MPWGFPGAPRTGLPVTPWAASFIHVRPRDRLRWRDSNVWVPREHRFAGLGHKPRSSASKSARRIDVSLDFLLLHIYRI